MVGGGGGGRQRLDKEGERERERRGVLGEGHFVMYIGMSIRVGALSRVKKLQALVYDMYPSSTISLLGGRCVPESDSSSKNLAQQVALI